MTTIVYSVEHKAIAYDSRLTCGSEIISDKHEKSIKVGDRTFFMSGVNAHAAEFADRFAHLGETRLPEKSCCALMVDGDRKVWRTYIADGRFVQTPAQHDEGIGSGYIWALAHLDQHGDIKAAVEYAATKDSNTGGPVQMFPV